MVITCSAYGCKEKFIKGGPVTFHSFPKDEVKRKIWELQTKRKDFKATDHSRICSNHFTPDCFDTEKFGGTWLKSDAVPTIFDFPEHLQKLSRNILKLLPKLSKSNVKTGSSTYNSIGEKRKHYLGDFNDDMSSPTKAKKMPCIAQEIAVTYRQEMKTLNQSTNRVKKELPFLNNILMETESKPLISDSLPKILEENSESDDPPYPGVTVIHLQSMQGKVLKIEEEFDIQEEEDIGKSTEMYENEDDDEGISNESSLDSISDRNITLSCLSVRIGSYKVIPKSDSFIHVSTSQDGLLFDIPVVTDSNKIVTALIRTEDITEMLFHSGRFLPVLYIFTTTKFAEVLRKALNMQNKMYAYFNPNSNDEKVKMITFLIDRLTEYQCTFLRESFLPREKIKELDQKTANEILVKSTSNQPKMEIRDTTLHQHSGKLLITYEDDESFEKNSTLWSW